MMASIFSISRGAIVSFIIGMIVWLVILQRNRVVRIVNIVPIIVTTVFFAALIFNILPCALQETFVAKFDQALYEITEAPQSNLRIVRWETSLSCLVDAPMGIGVGNYKWVMSPMNSSMGGSAHNLFLETLLESGFLALIALVAILVCYFKNIVGLFTSAKKTDELLLAASLMMIFVIYVSNVSIEPNYYSITFTYLFSVLMAISFALPKIWLFSREQSHPE
jgi:O-antigen ligase